MPQAIQSLQHRGEKGEGWLLPCSLASDRAPQMVGIYELQGSGRESVTRVFRRCLLN